MWEVEVDLPDGLAGHRCQFFISDSLQEGFLDIERRKDEVGVRRSLAGKEALGDSLRGACEGVEVHRFEIHESSQY